MKYSQKLIDKMKQLYRDHDGSEIDDEEANEAWVAICDYFETLIRWDKEEKEKEKNKAT